MKELNRDKLAKLNELFGSYRAEWLRGKVFDFFTEPSYFVTLKDHRPCILQGGRGTGKTTVLRGLSYQGQYALHNSSIAEFDKSSFIGIYHRANTNHVRAFCGGGVNEDIWKNIFAHYFNLVICREILLFVKWHKEISPTDDVYSSKACSQIAKSIHISVPCNNHEELFELFENSMYEFQAQVNNIANGNIPLLSMYGDPIKIITEQTVELSQFKNKMFYILLDEYENYEDYQQQILNTFIKHNTELYTFKVGVRELGWRVKHTLNNDELLNDPADYDLINITDELTEGSSFSIFAKDVCQQRIKDLMNEPDLDYSIEKGLPHLSMDEEAKLLNIKNNKLLQSYKKLSEDFSCIVNELPLLYCYFIAYWATSHNMSLEIAIDDYRSHTKKWDERYTNYKYEMLFKIRKGRGMTGIQKYYAGWNTYVKLANGNIRYLMELVYKAYEKHLSQDKDLLAPVSYEDQTIAAQEIGMKNLMELEGLWKNGAQLTKLLLGFGRIFNVLCSEEEVSTAPEINQISIENIDQKECNDIITAAVMNLALIRIPGNKLNGFYDTREYMYAIHPIFAPYFVFSYRKKRKMVVTQEEFLGVISHPKEYIKKILSKKKIVLRENNLPTQLSLFEDFYND